MKFLRNHWFGLVIGSVIFVFMILFVLILLSPRQDAQRRGFIPCTETMADEILSCPGNKFVCLLSAITANSWCDIKVVGQGFYRWVGGEQKTPWSNYIFVPEIPTDAFFDENAREAYLKTSPNIQVEMQQLQKLNKELENAENIEPQVDQESQPE